MAKSIADLYIMSNELELTTNSVPMIVGIFINIALVVTPKLDNAMPSWAIDTCYLAILCYFKKALASSAAWSWMYCFILEPNMLSHILIVNQCGAKMGQRGHHLYHT